jgi:hypothetical protein
VARVGRHLHVAGVSDPWGGIDGKDEYDPEGFYVKSLNKHDHTAQTRVPMDPDVYSEINRLVASGDLAGTPIKSYQAFMRDAAVHNMHRIARLLRDERLAEFARIQRLLAQTDQLTVLAETLRKTVTDADDRLNIATKSGDVHLVTSLLEVYEPLSNQLRAPYGEELEEVCKDARSWLRAKR